MGEVSLYAAAHTCRPRLAQALPNACTGHVLYVYEIAIACQVSPNVTLGMYSAYP